MVRRKERTPVVFDTNVLVRALKTQDQSSPNRRVLRLWLVEGKLQLVVCPELVEEYLRVFSEVLGLPSQMIDRWQRRFNNDRRCTCINLGRRFTWSRDPDDNLLLAVAHAGQVQWLITNDKDLLELPHELERSLTFSIVAPDQFLQALGRR